MLSSTGDFPAYFPAWGFKLVRKNSLKIGITGGIGIAGERKRRFLWKRQCSEFQCL
jgi:hypothetical protein